MLYKNIEHQAQGIPHPNHTRTKLRLAFPLKEQHQRSQPYVVNQYLAEYQALKGSTTYFLEHQAQKKLSVDVVEQAFIGHPTLQLFRRAILRFGPTCNALIYAESLLNLSLFTAYQKRALMRGSIAIGKLLDPQQLGLIQKNDIHEQWIHTPDELNTRYPFALMRHYHLLYQGEVCAEIREVLNHESLQRIDD